MIKFLPLLLLLAGSAQAQHLSFTFIGNEAFRFTDGEHMLYSDFPYQSGAFGYNTYNPDYLIRDTSAATIITHRHRDHFAPELLVGVKWTALESEGDTLWGTVVASPVVTPHSDLSHRSWLVDWNGFRLYFVGDTEDTEQLLKQSNLDVAFVTPWLVASVEGSGERIDARHVVVYHHTANQKINCRRCLVPAQGDEFYLTKGALDVIARSR